MDLIAKLSVGLFFIANITYCIAYVVRDILWLRILTIIAALLTFPYFIVQVEVLYSALLWQSAFALINIINVAKLLHERRPVSFTDDEQMLRNLVFPNFTPYQLKQFFALAQWHKAEKSDVLFTEGTKPAELYLLADGEVDILQNGNRLQRRLSGTFIGELSMMTDNAASADVVFATQSRYVSWSHAAIQEFQDRHPDFARSFNTLLSLDVARKLRSS